MLSHIALLSESFPSDTALVWFVAFMHQGVIPEVPALAKPLVTAVIHTLNNLLLISRRASIDIFKLKWFEDIVVLFCLKAPSLLLAQLLGLFEFFIFNSRFELVKEV